MNEVQMESKKARSAKALMPWQQPAAESPAQACCAATANAATQQQNRQPQQHAATGAGCCRPERGGCRAAGNCLSGLLPARNFRAGWAQHRTLPIAQAFVNGYLLSDDAGALLC